MMKKISIKKAELMEEITKFKLEDNDNITSQLEKGQKVWM